MPTSADVCRGMGSVGSELFPVGFDQGYRLHGFGRQSRKLSGLKLRKIMLVDGPPTASPSFVTSYMTEPSMSCLSVALGGAWRSALAADDRFRS